MPSTCCFVFILFMFVSVFCLKVEQREDPLAGTKLELAFVVFRHGDRTPDPEESMLYKPNNSTLQNNTYFPFGPKALTNKGKRRGHRVGAWLRQRYDGWLPKLYMNDHLMVRCTDYARTKMTALTALSALYPPNDTQLRWHPKLNWQPIPYEYEPGDEDDLLYWYNCPRYLKLRNKVYTLPEVQKRLQLYDWLFQKLSKICETTITTPEDVFFLDNLFQANNNVNIKTPPEIENLMSQIQEMTRIEYELEFYNDELIKLSSGVLLESILNKTQKVVVSRSHLEPRLNLYSAHENNVAALMAAARVFTPHQPPYGATFALELRQRHTTGQYFIAAVYAPDPAGPTTYLPISGCGGAVLCDYQTFLMLTDAVRLNKAGFRKMCSQNR